MPLPHGGPQRLLRVCAHRNPGDVDVAVGDRLEREILLRHALPPAANFATAPSGVAFDVCPPVFE